MNDVLFTEGQRDAWRPIGQDVLHDLQDLMFGSTPYTAIETSIMQSTLRGELGYTAAGGTEKFPRNEADRLKGRLIQLWRYWAMCGMVPVRRVPDEAPFFHAVVDASSGYFVARIDAHGRARLGWHTNGAPAGLVDGAFFLGTDHRPDEDVDVFVWPGKEPDVRLAVPFRSLLAPLLQEERMRRELARNHMAADALASRPAVFVSLAEARQVTAGGAREEADLQNSVEAIANGRTKRGEWEAQRMAEAIEMDEQRRNMSRDRAAPEVDGYERDGKRRHIVRDGVSDRMVSLPAGARVQTTPSPAILMDWTMRERHFYDTFHYVLGWPSQTRGSKAQGAAGHGGISQDDMRRMRTTVMGAREVMAQGFAFVYSTYMAPAHRRALEEEHGEKLARMDGEIRTLRDYLVALERAGMEHADIALHGTETYIERRIEDERTLEHARRQTRLDNAAEAVIEDAAARDVALSAGEVRANIERLLPPAEADDEVLMDRLRREAGLRSAKLDEVLAAREAYAEASREAVERVANVELVFHQPVPFNTDLLIQLGRDGVLNADAVLELVLDQVGLSDADRGRLLAGVPPDQKKWGAPPPQDQPAPGPPTAEPTSAGDSETSTS